MIKIGNINELQNLLDKQGADYSIIKNKTPILSVSDAAEFYNLTETAPVFILSTDLGPYSLIASGQNYPISFSTIAKALSCINVKLLPRRKVFEAIGYQPGSVPLIGLNLPCLFDRKLLDYPYIYGGIGEADYTLKINPHDIIKINNVAAIIDF